MLAQSLGRGRDGGVVDEFVECLTLREREGLGDGVTRLLDHLRLRAGHEHSAKEVSGAAAAAGLWLRGRDGDVDGDHLSVELAGCKLRNELVKSHFWGCGGGAVSGLGGGGGRAGGVIVIVIVVVVILISSGSGRLGAATTSSSISSRVGSGLSGEVLLPHISGKEHIVCCLRGLLVAVSLEAAAGLRLCAREKILNHRVNILSLEAHLSVLSGLNLDERGIGDASHAAADFRLADAGGADH